MTVNVSSHENVRHAGEIGIPLHAFAVLGPVGPDELGLTLTHEHLLLDFRAALKKPDYGSDCLSDLQLKMEHLGKIRQYP